MVAFDWGLILLTAWAGANSVTDQVASRWTLGTTIALVVFLVLLVAGVAVQGAQLRAKK